MNFTVLHTRGWARNGALQLSAAERDVPTPALLPLAARAALPFVTPDHVRVPSLCIVSVLICV